MCAQSCPLTSVGLTAQTRIMRQGGAKWVRCVGQMVIASSLVGMRNKFFRSLLREQSSVARGVSGLMVSGLTLT